MFGPPTKISASFYSLKALNMQPLQPFLLPSQTSCLTSWLSQKMSTLWRTSRWPWPAAPPQPLRFTSNVTASGFTRMTIWLSGLLIQPQVRTKSSKTIDSWRCHCFTFLFCKCSPFCSWDELIVFHLCVVHVWRVIPYSLFIMCLNLCRMEIMFSMITVPHRALSSS